jgi:GPH family glycoside/pentoside/hexuronide:cation symporter
MLYSAGIGSIGIALPIILPVLLLGENTNIPAFRMWMAIVGIAAALMLYLGSYVIKENAYAQMEDTLGFFDSIKQTLKNKPFMILEISIFSMVIMQNILFGFLVFVTDYLIDFSFENPVNIVMIVILVAILIYSVLWVVRNIPKYGIKKLTIFGAMVGGIGFAFLLILGLFLQPNQLNKMPLYIGFAPLIFVVLGLIVFTLTNQPLMADAIDYDELLTGKRRETTYSGVNALITKPAVSIGKAFFLLIIGAFGYISAEQGELSPPPSAQPIEVAMGVLIAFCLVPMICLIIAAISMVYFPLDGPSWFEKKRGIQEVHKMKEEKYIEMLKKQNKEI